MQQNIDGSLYFNQSWETFKFGFGIRTCNYWLGNELIHQLTKDGQYKLRFDVQAEIDGKWYWAEYSTFVVDSEETKYYMNVSGYSGNAGDAMTRHNPTTFTTFDSDNDEMHLNCANNRGGGFWWKACGYAQITGSRLAHHFGFTWRKLPLNDTHLLKSRAWLMCP